MLQVMTRRAWALSLVVSAPALALALVEASVLGIALFGSHPRWPDPALNLSEATAVRDNAEVIRLLERGDDPNARLTVRAGLLGNDAAVSATPMEAAVSIRRTELMSLLFRRGAALRDDDWRRLRCVAERQEFGDVVRILDQHRGPASQSACTGEERLW
jgi:hypothetical protein